MFDRVLTAFYGEPWLIAPDKFDVIEAALLARVFGDVPLDPSVAAELAKWSDGPPHEQARGGSAKDDAPPYLVQRGVAVVPVKGTITPRPSAFSSGGTSARVIADRMKLAAADSRVRGIMMDVDSPGGSAMGIEEAADAVTAAGKAKPVWAAVDPEAASGAYWLATQAHKVYVSPGGHVGCIGVLTRHFDRSARMEKDGVKVTHITTAPFKDEGHPYAPLSEAGKEHLLTRAREYHGRFVAGVAAGRRVDPGVVEQNFGRGRMVLDRAAVAAGMADGVAARPDVLASLQAVCAARSRAAATAAAASASAASLGLAVRPRA